MKNLDVLMSKLKLLKKYMYVGLIILLTCLGYYFAVHNSVISRNANSYGQIICFYSAAISFSLGIILIMMKFPSTKILNFIGKNTIIYMSLHHSLINLLKYLVPFFKTRILANILLCIILYILLIPISMLISKVLPIAVGKSYKKKIEA